MASNKFSQIITDPLLRIGKFVGIFLQGEQPISQVFREEYYLPEFRDLQELLIKSFNLQYQKNSVERELIKIATQVAHDIRSPLTALTIVAESLPNISEESRLIIRNASNRINDIANNLLTKYRKPQTSLQTKTQPGSEILSPELVVALVDSVLSEKRYQFAGKNIKFDLIIKPNAYGLFVLLNNSEFKRVLSNIINNSVEAIFEKIGLVTVTLQREFKKVKIVIVDNGCGIPSDLLAKITEGGLSIGKAFGFGLGLSYATQKIREWNGDYKLTSEVNVGTTFTMILPMTETPQWFQGEIEITNGQNIIIFDDVESIHNLWTLRFKNTIPNFIDENLVNLIHCYMVAEMLTYVKMHRAENNLYLVDYELLNQGKTGLDIIKELEIIEQSILVTSHYEDVQIRTLCINLGIKVIPKSYAMFIPLILKALEGN